MTYTMIFALSQDMNTVVLLKKPINHKNPIFADKWTAPGGKVEINELPIDCAAREMREETSLCISTEHLRYILRFSCNCDITESEHEVYVYGVILNYAQLNTAIGSVDEPVNIFNKLPNNILWYIESLLTLVKGRMVQPITRLTR